MYRITKGKAVLTDNQLRCSAPRKYDSYQPCNKLIALKNAAGQLAGSFKCSRCNQDVHVESTVNPLIPSDIHNALLELWEAQKELGNSSLGYCPRYTDAVQRLIRLENAGNTIHPLK